MREWSDKVQRPDRVFPIEAAILGVLQIFAIVGLVMMLFAPQPVDAHPSGLAADGCHNDRKNGGRHCHQGSKAGETTKPARSGDVYYVNCTAARNAGAAPVRRGEPVYVCPLDRANDEIDCE